MQVKKIKQEIIKVLTCLLCLCFLTSAVADSLSSMSSTQKKLFTYTSNLEVIEDYLNKDIISQERVTLFDEQLKHLYTKVILIKKDAEQNLKQQEALIEVLGPKPTDSEVPEDEVTNAKRLAIQERIAQFQGMVKLTDSLLFEIKKSQNALLAIALKNKAKGLLVRQEPLYDFQVLAYAWNDKALAAQSVIQAYTNAGIDVTDTPFKHHYSLLIYYILLAAYLALPFAFVLYQKYGQRKKDATPGTFRKILTGVIQLFCFAILPVFSIWLLLNTLKICSVIEPSTWTLILISFLPISVIIFSKAIANVIFPLHKPNWIIPPLEPDSAKRVKKYFMMFMVLVAINWYLTKLFYTGLLTVDFYIVLDFILRLFVCLVGLCLLHKRHWVTTDNVIKQTKSKHHWLALALKYLSIFVFVTNPLFIFFGFLQLANSIFLSFIEIILLVMLLLSAHYILGELLARLFFGKDKKQAAKRVAWYYWTMLFIDVIFFISGLFFILLSIGIDKTIIFRYVMPIFSGIKIGHYVFSIKVLLLSVLTLFSLYVLTRLIQRALRYRVLPNTAFDLGTREAIVQGVGYVGIIVAIIAALVSLGVNFTNLAIIAGALSVGIGFGLQNIVSNFISGVIMLIERPIKVGDRIVVGTDEGIVKRISVRATEIETFEHSSVLIPNSELISGRLQNWTFHSPLNRLSVSIGVDYGTDVKKVEALLLAVAKENANVVDEPPPRVYFDDFGDNALIFRLLVFIHDINLRNRTPSSLRFAIEEKFRQNNINIPFPQRVIHIKE